MGITYVCTHGGLCVWISWSMSRGLPLLYPTPYPYPHGHGYVPHVGIGHGCGSLRSVNWILFQTGPEQFEIKVGQQIDPQFLFWPAGIFQSQLIIGLGCTGSACPVINENAC